MGDFRLHQEVTGTANWLGKDLQESDAWIRVLTNGEIAEIEAALVYVKSAGLSPKDLTADDFPLPSLSGLLADMRIELEEGLGSKLLRGFPTEDFSKDDLRLIYWGIGLHVGCAVSQSKRNDFLGDVRDLGTGLDGPKFRGYTSNGELTYHVDAADVTGLFCLRAAKEGGLSRIVSSVAIHNEILQSRPDLLEALYEPIWWSMQGNELPNVPGFYTQPVFGIENGFFACRYTRTHIRSAEMNPDVPDLTPAQSEAMDLIDEISARPAFHRRGGAGWAGGKHRRAASGWAGLRAFRRCYRGRHGFARHAGRPRGGDGEPPRPCASRAQFIPQRAHVDAAPRAMDGTSSLFLADLHPG